MEAMWINFECKGEKFVVRPFLGGVNGITGEATVGNMSSLLRRMNQLSRAQDYIVLPDQMWLDGIATRPGKVRQFVAAETAPPRQEKKAYNITRKAVARKAVQKQETNDMSWDEEDARPGASIEWQVTGQDAVGGIQLQIIPTYDVQNMFAGSTKNVCHGFWGLESYAPLPDGAREFDVLNTPDDEGLDDGQIIHIKNLRFRLDNRDKTVADLMSEAPTPLSALDVVQLEFKRLVAPMCRLNVRRPGALGFDVCIEVKCHNILRCGMMN